MCTSAHCGGQIYTRSSRLTKGLNPLSTNVGISKTQCRRRCCRPQLPTRFLCLLSADESPRAPRFTADAVIGPTGIQRERWIAALLFFSVTLLSLVTLVWYYVWTTKTGNLCWELYVIWDIREIRINVCFFGWFRDKRL